MQATLTRPQPADLLPAKGLDRLAQRSGRLVVDDLDFSVFEEQPLDEDTLRCLRYMHDIEGHTMCYLRDLLVTRVHKDPQITEFLACWVYEEHWHGEAIARVLAAHGEVSGAARLELLRTRLGWKDSVRPWLFGIGSSALSQLPAVHMAWGALNELTTQAGYARLSAKAAHPMLTQLLSRIMRQEGRHIDFYAGQARNMLAGSASARRLARFALRKLWAPVGSGVMAAEEVVFLAQHLFGDADGLESAKRVDRHFNRLPGLDGLNLLEKAVSAGRPA